MTRFTLEVATPLALALVALASVATPATARAGAFELCVHGCVEDYYPFHHTCAAGCLINDIVFGAVGVENDGETFKLAAEPEDRAGVLLEAATFGKDGRTFELDPDVYEVHASYSPLDDYLDGRASWTEIGSGTLSSRSATWQIAWDASRVPAGEYVVLATFHEDDGFRDAILAVQVP